MYDIGAKLAQMVEVSVFIRVKVTKEKQKQEWVYM